MANRVIMSPRGFANGSNDCLLPANPDKEICFDWSDGGNETAFFENFRRFYSPTVPPEMFIELSLRLTAIIQDPHRWALLNAKFNPSATKYNVDFIVDTIRFALTGHRSIDHLAWDSLLPRDRDLGYKFIDRSSAFNQTYFPTIDELMSQWAAQRGGIHDMFHTYRLLTTRH